jgi:hypothetical protein
VYWPRNTEYEIFNTGGTNTRWGRFLVVNHRTVFESAVVAPREVRRERERKGRCSIGKAQTGTGPPPSWPSSGLTCFELANNHHWRGVS